MKQPMTCSEQASGDGGMPFQMSNRLEKPSCQPVIGRKAVASQHVTQNPIPNLPNCVRNSQTIEQAATKPRTAPPQ